MSQYQALDTKLLTTERGSLVCIKGSDSHVNTLFHLCSALTMTLIFLCIWVDFLIVFGYGVWNFWSIDVADSDVYGLLLTFHPWPTKLTMTLI